ncbi:hypothetical protein [Sorangium sp. So ce887]|uniref:hypothetical protein n=1 Tax=Sorangium sp. So ce887 TaxID=3133324 RepID=UPI003F6454E9
MHGIVEPGTHDVPVAELALVELALVELAVDPPLPVGSGSVVVEPHAAANAAEIKQITR